MRRCDGGEHIQLCGEHGNGDGCGGEMEEFETDVFGNLMKVTEPDPAAGNVDTTYTYNLQNEMTEGSMVRGDDSGDVFALRGQHGGGEAKVDAKNQVMECSVS